MKLRRKNLEMRLYENDLLDILVQLTLMIDPYLDCPVKRLEQDALIVCGTGGRLGVLSLQPFKLHQKSARHSSRFYYKVR